MMTNKGSFDEVLTDLADYVEFRLEQGDRTEEMVPTAADAGEGTNFVVSEEQAVSPAPELLDRIAVEIGSCAKCSLSETRTNTVPGQGTSGPDIMFIGEAPGMDEDRQGLAFVGKAGQLLTKMIEAMGYSREEVFIGNILKCRPPDNRAPLPEEMETCLPYLKAQIRVLQPKVIITLGATAAKGLLDVSVGITRLRGKWLSFEGIDVMPTYHPAYLLRTPSAKREAWEDLKAVLGRLGREVPERKK
jgi:DNA polymerase